MDSSVPINAQPSRIALDRCLSFLDQDVLRIRHAVDSFTRRRQELSQVLAGIQFPCPNEGLLNPEYMSNDEFSFSAFLASDESSAYSPISDLPPPVADSSLVVPDYLIPEVLPSASIVTDLPSVGFDSSFVVSSDDISSDSESGRLLTLYFFLFFVKRFLGSESECGPSDLNSPAEVVSDFRSFDEAVMPINGMFRFSS
jgi:hypothetical protein